MNSTKTKNRDKHVLRGISAQQRGVRGTRTLDLRVLLSVLGMYWFVIFHCIQNKWACGMFANIKNHVNCADTNDINNFFSPFWSDPWCVALPLALLLLFECSDSSRVWGSKNRHCAVSVCALVVIFLEYNKRGSECVWLCSRTCLLHVRWVRYRFYPPICCEFKEHMRAVVCESSGPYAGQPAKKVRDRV